MSDYELFQKYPDQMEKFHSMTADISGGTSAIVALIHVNKLFVANVGELVPFKLKSFLFVWHHKKQIINTEYRIGQDL